jgi:hypothetical protein
MPRLTAEAVDTRRRHIESSQDHTLATCQAIHTHEWVLYRDVLEAIAAGHAFPEALAQAAIGPDRNEQEP